MNLIFFISTLYGQEFIQKKWIKFHADHPDGSRIINRHNINDAYFEYYFNDNHEVTISSCLGIYNMPYTLTDSILKISNTLRYKIQEIQSDLMVLVEIPKEKMEIDKTNRLYFTTEDHYFDNVLKLSLVSFQNDSTIIANRYIKPKLIQIDYNKYFINAFKGLNIDSMYLAGSFVLSPGRLIMDIRFDSITILLPDELKKIEEIFLSTIYKWQPPIPSFTYYYLIKYKVQISHGNIIALSFFDDTYDKTYKPITSQEENSVLNSYRRGNSNFKKKNFDNAITFYTECLKNDPIFIEAIYQRAESYKYLNKMSEACADWKYLNDLGQTKGIRLYKNNCTK